jgi:hypothetical protein
MYPDPAFSGRTSTDSMVSAPTLEVDRVQALSKGAVEQSGRPWWRSAIRLL